MRKTITTSELERACEITYRTIRNYVKAGWIPQAKLRSFGKGTGKGSATLHWDVGIVTQLSMIKALKRSGYKNNQIGKILKGEK